MERPRLLFAATASVFFGLVVTTRLFGILGAWSWLDVFVIPLLSFLIAWPAVVYFSDLRNFRAARAAGVELAPFLKEGFLNIPFFYASIRDKGETLAMRMDPACEK
jgi:hypothetical protein